MLLTEHLDVTSGDTDHDEIVVVGITETIIYKHPYPNDDRVSMKWVLQNEFGRLHHIEQIAGSDCPELATAALHQKLTIITTNCTDVLKFPTAPNCQYQQQYTESPTAALFRIGDRPEHTSIELRKLPKTLHLWSFVAGMYPVLLPWME